MIAPSTREQYAFLGCVFEPDVVNKYAANMLNCFKTQWPAKQHGEEYANTKRMPIPCADMAELTRKCAKEFELALVDGEHTLRCPSVTV